MPRFKDLILLHDGGLRTLLRHVRADELILALKNAPPELRDKVLKNFPKRAATLIRERSAAFSPDDEANVNAAQQKIMDCLQRLEDAGEVSFLPDEG